MVGVVMKPFLKQLTLLSNVFVTTVPSEFLDTEEKVKEENVAEFESETDDGEQPVKIISFGPALCTEHKLGDPVDQNGSIEKS